jgi:outer membrane protein TolC
MSRVRPGSLPTAAGALVGLGFGLGLSLPSAAGAEPVQDPAPVLYRLTTHDPLGPLVEEAFEANASLAAARLAEAGAGVSVQQARGHYFPSVGLEARYSEQRGTINLGGIVNPAYATLNELTGSDRFPTNLDLPLPLRHETRLRVVQPVFNAAVGAQHDLAEHQHEAERESRRAAARRLAADVQFAYLDVLSAESAVRILQAGLQRVEESERVAQRLVDAGRATADALFRARAERSDVAQQVEEAREGAAAARRALNHLMGRPFDARVEVLSDSLLIRELDLTEEEAVASALAGREELHQLDAGERAAEAGVRLAGASILPSVALAVDYGFQGQDIRFASDVDYLIATVSASWSLFTGGSDQARRDGARLEVSRLRAQRRDVEDRLGLDVRQAYSAAVVARGAIRTAGERLEAARRTYELVSRRYEEGVAPHIELVDARAGLTSAELNRSLTLYRYVARTVDLERAAALRAID